MYKNCEFNLDRSQSVIGCVGMRKKTDDEPAKNVADDRRNTTFSGNNLTQETKQALMRRISMNQSQGRSKEFGEKNKEQIMEEFEP